MKTKVNDQAVFDKPRAAVAAFQRLCPQLTSYARIVTGDRKIRVQPGKQSMTDGTTIWVRPPLSLATPKRHQYDVCNEYFYGGVSMCPACASREEMMTAVHHEIAHCAFGSFEPYTSGKAGNLAYDLSTELPRSVYEKMSGAWHLNGWLPEATKPLIAIVNTLGDKYLSALYFFTEDMRVNEKSYIARTGLRQQAMAFERTLLHDGIENDDGTFTLWGDQPIDAQICVGVYLSANDNDLVGHLDSTVVEVLSRGEIKRRIKAVVNSTDVRDTFVRTVQLLVALRQLGHLLYVEPEQDDQGDDDENGEDTGDGSQGDSTGGSAGDDEGSKGGDPSGDSMDAGDNAAEASDQEGNDSEGDGSDGDSGTQAPPTRATPAQLERILSEIIGHAGEIEASSTGPEGAEVHVLSDIKQEEDESNLTKVINTAWILDHIPRNIEGINVNEKGNGAAFESSGYYGSHSRPANVPDQALIGKSIMQARIAFGNNARVEHHRNQRTGKVQSNVLGKRAHLGDDRLFGKKIVPDKRSYHVLIGFDVSYSTADGAIDYIKDAVRALADVCSAVNVEFSIYAHSSEETGYGEENMSVGIYKVKEASDRWDRKAKDLLDKITPVSGNLDGHTLQYYRKELDKSRATDKVLMYFTDGKMPASNHDEELAVLRDEIELCKRKQYTLLGVGIGTSSPTKHGLDTVRVDGPEDYQAVVKHLTKRMMK